MVWKYQSQANLFWERLSLMIQVFSYLQNRESRYMPIQRKPETISLDTKPFKTKQIYSREFMC